VQRALGIAEQVGQVEFLSSNDEEDGQLEGGIITVVGGIIVANGSIIGATNGGSLLQMALVMKEKLSVLQVFCLVHI
jgi:hypothetical protein